MRDRLLVRSDQNGRSWPQWPSTTCRSGWLAVEGAADDEAKRRHRRFDVPSPRERGEGKLGHLIEAGIGGVTDGARRNLRVDEDRLAERCRGCEQAVVAWVVERRGGRAAVDHGADETQSSGAFELFRYRA